MHPLWLTFRSGELEARYARWHSAHHCWVRLLWPRSHWKYQVLRSGSIPKPPSIVGTELMSSAQTLGQTEHYPARIQG